MNDKPLELTQQSEWFAIRTRQDFRAEEVLRELCDDVFFPKEVVLRPDNSKRVKAVIPHVLFIRTSRDNALALEDAGRRNPERSIRFWIYRYPTDNKIQVIPARSIDLLRLTTSADTSGCEIYNNRNFKENEHVRVTGGPYQGMEGYVQRVRKNKHVIVKIEGICMVMLPFIHPDLLERIE